MEKIKTKITTTIKIAPEYDAKLIKQSIKNFLFNKTSLWSVHNLKKDTVVKESLLINNKLQPCIVKYFRAHNYTKVLGNKLLGKQNKAQRAFNHSLWLEANNIPTAKVIAYIVEKADFEIKRSACIYEYLPYSAFHLELSKIFWHSQCNLELMTLLQFVALHIKNMHDKGFLHGDLGNQNILINKKNNIWQQLAFIDLDRSNIIPNLTLSQRAKDLARIQLPSHYRKIFLQLYWGESPIPSVLNKAYKVYRKRYLRKYRYTWLRHPVRSYKAPPNNKTLLYPIDKDSWLWDEKSAQAMIMLTNKDKNKYRNYRDYLKMGKNIVQHYPSIRQLFQKNIQQAYQTPIDMQQRIGIALHPYTNYIEYESGLLAELQQPPVLIRFGQHESIEQWNTTIAYIKQLHHQGLRISVAFLQNRNSVLHPQTWYDFLAYVLKQINDQIHFVEIAHAINRVKWGIWNTQDYITLLQSAATIQKNLSSPQNNWASYY